MTNTIAKGVSFTFLAAAGAAFVYTLFKSDNKQVSRSFSSISSNPTKWNKKAFDKCDCKPLWDCLQSGDDCKKLDQDLRNCVNKIKSLQLRKN
ncbi:hypothetical protein M0812_01061 [Anaeramoeba flamelloides]|uniref:Uncharacterized protein n=1 Tax=Anaeramoeba flamelloides TaxID=1746091 RepID=A0AAV8A4R4_9EUKA|nr:hypothetical protein M0812_01061 [Anaeramoeba flamelloides]|eukprot:Anaeramoba_flamelloidesa1112161_15.p1 GENE.a1112161_15~~a1112161_15.p1  ORF type:complete len:103 (+),score=12.23 a1112161_15:33-311(+)